MITQAPRAAPSLVVTGLHHFDRDNRHGVSAHVVADGHECDLWYRSSSRPLAESGDTFLPAMLLPAMTLGGCLRIDGAISSRLLDSLPVIQDILHCWIPALQKVSLEAGSRARATTTVGRGVACFFSGGVDSFYTFLKHRDEITHLIFVHGFDLPLENEALRLSVAEVLRAVAAEVRLPLIEVETNLRAFADRYVDWSYYCGAALASVGLLLAPQFRKIYFPSTYSYRHLHPWGSHPILDPLWSSNEMEVVHDGCEASRAEKVAYIVRSDVVLKSLRVCWENRGGAYNCGQCEKCLRTMVSLRAAGVLDSCTTFKTPLDLKRVARIDSSKVNVRSFVDENLRLVEAANSDAELAQALRESLEGRYSRKRGRARELAGRILATSYGKRVRATTRRLLADVRALKP